jgi:isopentenyl-diphosphate Delta-isomerase
LFKNVEKLVYQAGIPVIIKEVGAGISKNVAKSFLDIGIQGIDTAGAGGTSWSAVEILRNKEDSDNPFWDWGLPTAYCIRKISALKKDYDFLLIGSGGINNSFDAAKAFALGADFVASARIILQALNHNGLKGVIELINGWFEDIKKILYLTGSQSLETFNKSKLIKLKDMR